MRSPSSFHFPSRRKPKLMDSIAAGIDFLSVRKRSVFRLRYRREGRLDYGEAFVKLFIGDNQGNQNADDIVERSGGDGDEAVLVAETRDLLSFRVSGLSRRRIAYQFHRAHAAQAANLANQGIFFLPGASAVFEAAANPN